MNKQQDFASLGKTELRAACKAASISYSKLTNDGMRDALVAHYAKDDKVVYKDGMTQSEAHNAHCPHCDVHLSNGLLHRDDESYTDGGRSTGQSLWQRDGMVKEFECMGCGGQFGPECEPYVAKAAADRHSGTGLKIEKNREERNGIKRPSAGGKCRAIWDYLDAQVAAGTTPTPKLVRAEAESQGWNTNNAVIELYQWRKFSA